MRRPDLCLSMLLWLTERVISLRRLEGEVADLDEVVRPVAPEADLKELLLSRIPACEGELQDPHMLATDVFPVVDHPTEGPIRSMKVSATWSETPAEPVRLAPRLNEHGAEILGEAGYSADEIAALVRDGATKSPT